MDILGCFHLLAVVVGAVKNIHAQIFEYLFSGFFFGKYLEMELLGHGVILF